MGDFAEDEERREERLKEIEWEKQGMLPAIPPEDYRGTIGNWRLGLVRRGLLPDDGEAQYVDLEIPESVYDELLEECESDNPPLKQFFKEHGYEEEGR